MLEPDGRRLLLDALRPPPGQQLDLAVGTTYSLDLLALLTTPLAFALFDREVDEDGAPDPVALLEAVRRHAERMHIYCQGGLIGLPRGNFQPLLVHLEQRIFEVTPPDRSRIFHPKVWVLRFRDADGVAGYRLVCATRNLTFARAWDTILILEGRAGEERHERNLPLARFIAALPGLCERPPTDEDRQEVRGLANELLQVDFEVPEGFEGVDFVTLGLEDGSSFPFTDADRMMVVAPFLTKGTLTRLGRSGEGNVLVSRPESLDGIGRAGLVGFETYVLSEFTNASDEGAGEASGESVGERPEVGLDGLHAKLFVLDRGERTHMWTGSANATDAAFNGNVELLVELVGPSGTTGIAALMRTEKGSASFRDLLEPYTPEQEEPVEETAAERLDQRLDEVQRAVAGRAYTAQVEEVDEGAYAVTLSTESLPELEGVTVRCWPISASALAKVVEGGSLSLRFEPISRKEITAFFAIELVAREGSVSREVRFVVTAELVGAPNDRRERILADLLDDRAKVLRFLLLLLAEEGLSLQAFEGTGGQTMGRFLRGFGTTALFESMLRTLANDPQRLDHIARLVEDLRKAGRQELLPEGFDGIWEPIWAVREGAR